MLYRLLQLALVNTCLSCSSHLVAAPLTAQIDTPLPVRRQDYSYLKALLRSKSRKMWAALVI
jgi:hypothetical protein